MHPLASAYQQPWAILPERAGSARAEALALPAPPLELAQKMATTKRRGRALFQDGELIEEGPLWATVEGSVCVIPVMGKMLYESTWRNSFYAYYYGYSTLQDIMSDFEWAEENPSISSILFRVNCIGGSAYGLDTASRRIFEMRGNKPIVTHVEAENDSAAYYLSSSSDAIFGTLDSTHGCIGVMCSWLNYEAALEAEGIKEILIVSKVSPDKVPDELTDKGLALYQEPIDALGRVFVQSVARNRGISNEDVIKDYGRGWVKVGKAALDAGMIDGILSYNDVLTNLQAGATAEDLKSLAESKAPRGVFMSQPNQGAIAAAFHGLGVALGVVRPDATAPTPAPATATAPEPAAADPRDAVIAQLTQTVGQQAAALSNLQGSAANTTQTLQAARDANIAAFRTVAQSKIAPAQLEGAIALYTALYDISPEQAQTYQATFDGISPHAALQGIPNPGAQVPGTLAAAQVAAGAVPAAAAPIVPVALPAGVTPPPGGEAFAASQNPESANTGDQVDTKMVAEAHKQAGLKTITAVSLPTASGQFIPQIIREG